MPDHDTAREAASLLLRHWDGGTRLDAIPEELRPATRDDGYAIQAAMEDVMGETLIGWKIAATSEAGQRHINVTGPMAGRLLAHRVIADGATVSLAANLMRVAEVEFAFRFGTDLPPRPAPYAVDEVLAAVATLHPVIEVPDSRYNDFTVVGAPQLIADNACAHVFMPGPAVDVDWRGIDLAAYAVSAVKNGAEVHRGVGANVLGDPRVALAWLVNELSGLGIPVKAGQIVTTGTCVVPVAVGPGDAVEADLGAFGRLIVRFA
jgi:2-keto-4-pentenoate hydratase